MPKTDAAALDRYGISLRHCRSGLEDNATIARASVGVPVTRASPSDDRFLLLDHEGVVLLEKGREPRTMDCYGAGEGHRVSRRVWFGDEIVEIAPQHAELTARKSRGINSKGTCSWNGPRTLGLKSRVSTKSR